MYTRRRYQEAATRILRNFANTGDSLSGLQSVRDCEGLIPATTVRQFFQWNECMGFTVPEGNLNSTQWMQQAYSRLYWFTLEQRGLFPGSRVIVNGKTGTIRRLGERICRLGWARVKVNGCHLPYNCPLQEITLMEDEEQTAVNERRRPPSTLVSHQGQIQEIAQLLNPLNPTTEPMQIYLDLEPENTYFSVENLTEFVTSNVEAGNNVKIRFPSRLFSFNPPMLPEKLKEEIGSMELWSRIERLLSFNMANEGLRLEAPISIYEHSAKDLKVCILFSGGDEDKAKALERALASIRLSAKCVTLEELTKDPSTSEEFCSILLIGDEGYFLRWGYGIKCLFYQVTFKADSIDLARIL